MESRLYLSWLALSIVVMTAVAGVWGHIWIRDRLTSELETETTRLRSAFLNEVARSVERAELLALGSHTNFRTANDQENYLKTQLETYPSLIAIALYEKVGGQWSDAFRLIRRKDDPARFSRPFFLELNERTPIDFEKTLHDGQVLTAGIVRFAQSENIPVLRIASSYGKRVLVVDLFLDEFFSEVQRASPQTGDSATTSLWVTNHIGRLVGSNQIERFRSGERVDHLTSVRWALNSHANRDHVEASDFPGEAAALTTFFHDRDHGLYFFAARPAKEVRMFSGMLILALTLTALGFYACFALTLTKKRVRTVGSELKRLSRHETEDLAA